MSSYRPHKTFHCHSSPTARYRPKYHQRKPDLQGDLCYMYLKKLITAIFSLFVWLVCLSVCLVLCCDTYTTFTQCWRWRWGQISTPEPNPLNRSTKIVARINYSYVKFGENNSTHFCKSMLYMRWLIYSFRLVLVPCQNPKHCYMQKRLKTRSIAHWCEFMGYRACTFYPSLDPQAVI